MADSPETTMERHPNIEVEEVTKTIVNGGHRVEILKGISFHVPRGQFVALMGASGSGKSTLLGLLAGLDAVTTGRILLDGVDITRLTEDELALLRSRKVGFVFQSFNLIPTLTAEENILLPFELSGAAGNGRAKARTLLDEVGLGHRGHHYPVQLSGGEQQRVALARAFITSPSILFADEPTGNLDSTNGQHILELLIQINRRRGTTLVMVTHDAALAGYADRRIVLRDGEVIADEMQTPMALALESA
ncbi:MAG: ABC transporter ATP-binding protein [Bryobacterales bacterium]|nr:ABC transporter ATP-binding protein [Bryobacterales bacterium]